MKHYHRLDILLENLRKQSFLNCSRLFLQLIRDRLFGTRRLIFGLYIHSKKVAGSNEENKEKFVLVSISSVEDISEQLWKEFERHPRLIFWDTRLLLQSGCRLWLGYSEDDLVCILWSIPGNIQKSYFFPMTEKCVLIGRCVTFPQFRRKGYFTRSLILLTLNLANEDFNRFYVDCAEWNVASKKAIERAGFLRIGHGWSRKRGLHWCQEAEIDVAKLFRSGEEKDA
jgi:RimJ/RimL family protein N-acetyltransferase